MGYVYVIINLATSVVDPDPDPDPVDPLLDVFLDLDLYYLSKIQRNLRKKFIIL